jgi:hypothetical protein
VDGGRGSSGYDHYRVKGGKPLVIDWTREAGDELVPVESDVPIAADGLPISPPAEPATSISNRAERFGDEPGF